MMESEAKMQNIPGRKQINDSHWKVDYGKSLLSYEATDVGH